MSSADACRTSPSPTAPDFLQLQPSKNSKKRSRRSRYHQPAPIREPTPPSANEYDSDASIDSVAEAAAAERHTKSELQCLLRTYGTYASARQWRNWSDLFVEDAVFSFEYCGQIHGRKELYYGALGWNELPYITSFFSDVHLELDPRRPNERATGTANMWFRNRTEPTEASGVKATGLGLDMGDDQDEEVPTAGCDYCGPYEFEFVNTEEGWKIKTMSLKVLNDHREETDRYFTKCDYIPLSSCGTPCP